MSINSLLNIGNSALSTTQNAISTIGNNIANVNTDGYSRQHVRIEEYAPVDRAFGQMGQGVHTAEVYRSFNRFVENAFLSRFSIQSRWSEQNTVLDSVQSLFNEANKSGIGSALSAFFDDWSDLSLRPDDKPTREALLSNAETLANLFNSTRKGLEDVQLEMDSYISQGVGEVNEILEAIKTVNSQIANAKIGDQRNANSLLDKRDSLVRELASWMDIKVDDRGGADFTVSTTSGLPLVAGQTVYSLEVSPGRVENALQKGSAYEGTMEYAGSDAQEYTFEVVTPPRAAEPPDTEGLAGTMRVSLDGGKTWLRNDDGTELHARIPVDGEETVKVKDLVVSFTADTSKLSAGDSFSIVPKSSLYWVKPTRDSLNITPQTLNDGTENPERLLGGKLGAYFNVRDENVGKYLDKLDALANSLAWEVNVLHSQGSGSKTMTSSLGSYEVRDTEIPLGLSGSGLAYSNRLSPGNLHIQMYDADGKPSELLSLDFDSTTPGVQNFDPQKHSLEDVQTAINNAGKDPALPLGAQSSKITASIMNGKLQITATEPGTSFSCGTDSTGLMAGLGINTFFTGSNSSDIAIKPDVVQDSSYINAGRVSADGTMPEGDNATAKAIIELATKAVNISTTWENNTQSLTSYYAGTVTRVGADARSAKFNNSYNTALANDLNDQTAAISGVNLDEEMTNLIKFQHSYTAAAKLITTADQMLQTLLGLKQ